MCTGPGNSKDPKILNRSNEVRASPSCRILKPSEGKLAEHGGTNLRFQHTECLGLDKFKGHASLGYIARHLLEQ